MEMLTQTKIIQELHSRQLNLFSTADFKKLFAIKKDNSVYKIIARLVNKGILTKLTKKRYLFTLSKPDDFLIANFLYPPSYLSLESALSFYSLISQFSYQITSITPKKNKTITALNKEFVYCRIKQNLFFGYEKKDDFLIAAPEKALLDYLYFCSKGLRNFAKDDFNLEMIDKKKLLGLTKLMRNQAINNFLQELNLC